MTKFLIFTCLTFNYLYVLIIIIFKTSVKCNWAFVLKLPYISDLTIIIIIAGNERTFDRCCPHSVTFGYR